MRFKYLVVAALTLAGCETPVPDSGAGVGFEEYSNYQSQREAELGGTDPLVSGATISDETVDTNVNIDTAIPTGQVAESTVAINRNNPGISDEQDFGAVSSRESIESDAKRRAAQQQAYQVIEPTALPTRGGTSGASIVEFALSTTNLVGQSIYRRSTILAQNRFDRNCAKYPSPDMAQEAFLKAGGPERDRRGLDPDGDGFACFWDPSPYRRATGG